MFSQNTPFAKMSRFRGAFEFLVSRQTCIAKLFDQSNDTIITIVMIFLIGYVKKHVTNTFCGKIEQIAKSKHGIFIINSAPQTKLSFPAKVKLFSR